MTENAILHSWIRIATADGAVYPFAIDPNTYVKRDIVDFAPRSGGGDVAYSNLDLYQIMTQDSWHHGIGFVQFRDKFGYRVTSDGVDARHVGMALMFPKHTTAYTAPSGAMKSCIDFEGATYFDFGVGGVWKRTVGGSWSKESVNGTVRDLLSTGSAMIATIASNRMMTYTDGPFWTEAGVSGNSPDDFGDLEMHNGFVWGAESNATESRALAGTVRGGLTGTLYVFGNTTNPIFGNDTNWLSDLSIGDLISASSIIHKVVRISSDTSITVFSNSTGYLYDGDLVYKTNPGNAYDCVHFWSSADSSDAEGGGITDIASITIGAGSAGIMGMQSFNGMLYVARTDGVWAIDDTVTPPVARRVLNFNDEQHSSNFAIFVAWRGRLYFNIKNMLYAYNGSSLANVTPPTLSLDFPPLALGGFIGATYRGPYLYVIAATNEPTPNYHLLAFDGTGWFQMLDLGATAPTGIGYSPLVDMMFIGLTGGAALSIPFQSKSELPYADFGTTGHHYLNLSEIDFGFRRVKKSFAEIDVEVYNVAAGRYVAVDYSADGGAWYRLGYTTVSGLTQMDMNPTVEANKLDVRLDFQTDSATQSPIERNVTIKAMIRPDTLYGHHMTVIGANEIKMLDGSTHKSSSEQMKKQLEAVRDSKAPVTFVDPFGVSHSGYISTVMFKELARRLGENQSNWSAQLNIVEVR